MGEAGSRRLGRPRRGGGGGAGPRRLHGPGDDPGRAVRLLRTSSTPRARSGAVHEPRPRVGDAGDRLQALPVLPLQPRVPRLCARAAPGPRSRRRRRGERGVPRARRGGADRCEPREAKTAGRGQPTTRSSACRTWWPRPCWTAASVSTPTRRSGCTSRNGWRWPRESPTPSIPTPRSHAAFPAGCGCSYATAACSRPGLPTGGESLARPMPPADLLAKFRDNAGRALPGARVDDLEHAVLGAQRLFGASGVCAGLCRG